MDKHCNITEHITLEFPNASHETLQSLCTAHLKTTNADHLKKIEMDVVDFESPL